MTIRSNSLEFGRLYSPVSRRARTCERGSTRRAGRLSQGFSGHFLASKAHPLSSESCRRLAAPTLGALRLALFALMFCSFGQPGQGLKNEGLAPYLLNQNSTRRFGSPYRALGCI